MTTILRQRMTEDMQVRNLSPQTQSAYIMQVSLFARHFNKSPAILGPEDIRAYQLYLSKYQEMASAYPQVLVSQRTYFQLQVDYIHTLGQLWSAATALNNFTLSGGLQQPAPSGSMESGSSSPD